MRKNVILVILSLSCLANMASQFSCRVAEGVPCGRGKVGKEPTMMALGTDRNNKFVYFRKGQALCIPHPGQEWESTELASAEVLVSVQRSMSSLIRLDCYCQGPLADLGCLLENIYCVWYYFCFQAHWLSGSLRLTLLSIFWQFQFSYQLNKLLLYGCVVLSLYILLLIDIQAASTFLPQCLQVDHSL